MRYLGLLLLATVVLCGAPSGAETSVRPGLNVEFLDPDVDVEKWVERFEREGREIFNQRERITKLVGLRPGMRVADIGTGTGLFVGLFAKEVGSTGRVYAVDIVPGFLELIDQRARQIGLTNVVTQLCTERSVELPPDSIDVAFICDTYHHFEYPASTMASLHRALRKGGQVVLVEFKRTEGESSDWILEHVRAGQAVFVSEIEQAGFELEEEMESLRDNYILRFRKR